MLLGSYVHGQTTLDSSVHPLYINRVYHFQVALPHGLTYTRTQPPNPDHGFAIDLSSGTKLWVDASYTDSASTQEEFEKQTADCRVEDKKPASLGGMVAITTRFTCSANAYHGSYEERLMVSVNRREGVGYQIAVRTDATRITLQAEALFQQIAAGFRPKKLRYHRKY